MKPLVYMACFGNAVYAEMARICIESLRGRGAYDGDIIVLGDGIFDAVSAGAGVRAVDVGKRGKFEIKCAKARAVDWIDVSGYDRIMSIDTDVVAVGDINALFDHCQGRMCGGDEEPFQTLMAPSMGACLNLIERLQVRNQWGINSGALITDAAVWPAYMRLWSAEMLRCKPWLKKYVDQPALNALVVRGEIEFLRYPRGWIEMPPLYRHFGGGTRFRPGPQTRLMHFCGIPDKDKTVRRMKIALERGN